MSELSRRTGRRTGRAGRGRMACLASLGAAIAVAVTAVVLQDVRAMPPASALQDAAEPDSAPAFEADQADPGEPGRRTVEVVLVGAGDIASCTSTGDEATANLLDGIAGTVFTVGDNVYPNGTATEFANCYGPSWGRHKARTRPAPGNHDYNTTGAAGYYGYFGAAAGEPGKGYYSYELGAWHIVAINSNCAAVGGCGAGSAQEQWLRQDLAAHPQACTLAYWHHPLFTSDSSHGNATSMRPIWQALYDHGADVVLAGHAHNYERFAPQDPNGVADPARGIRQFVVGTGGASLRRFGAIKPNSEVRNADTYGVLKLTLHPTSYQWEFVPEAGKIFTDSGSAACDGDLPSPGAPHPRTETTTEPGPPASLPTRRWR